MHLIERPRMIKPKDGNYRYFIADVVGKELEEAGL